MWLRDLKPWVQLGAATALLAAGAIHTFPFFWHKWENMLLTRPDAHYYIGGVGFFLGVFNLSILIHNYLKRA